MTVENAAVSRAMKHAKSLRGAGHMPKAPAFCRG